MKRSEMVSLIEDILLETAYQDRIDQWSVADEILRKIESKGMNPPFNHDNYYKNWRSGGLGDVWEPEE